MSMRVLGSLGASLLLMGALLNPTAHVVTAAVTNAAQASWANPAPLQDELNKIVSTYGALGATAEVRDAYRGVFTGTAGLSDPNTQAPVDPNSHFRIASLSKLFVAVTVLQLQSEGKLSLDDKVDKFLPGIVPNSNLITVRMLLNHTSGVFNIDDDNTFENYIYTDPSRSWTGEQLMQLVATHPPRAAAGSAYSYANTNYILAALIIEKVTGASYGDAITQRIINKLGLSGTSVPTTLDLPAPFMRGYGPKPRSGVTQPNEVTNLNPTFYYGFAQMVSTTHDVNMFYSALFGGQVLAPAQMDLLRTVVPMSPGNVADFYGMGVSRSDLHCGVTVWGHAGSLDGYQSETYISDNGQRVFTLFYSSPKDRINAPYNDMLNRVFCDIPLVSLGNSTDGPAGATINGYTHVFTRGSNGHLIWYRQQLTAAWERIDKGGAIVGNPAFVQDGHFRVFAQGTNKHLYTMDLDVGTWIDSGVTISSPPTALSLGIGSDDIFARAGDGTHIVHVTYDGTNWQSSLVPGASGVWSNLAVYSDRPGDFHIAYRHLTDARLAMTYTDEQGAWRTGFIGGVTLASSPTIMSYGPNNAEVYARGTNNHVIRAMYSPAGGWSLSDLGMTITGIPVVYTTRLGDTHVFALGTNKALYEYTNGKWVSRGGGLNGQIGAMMTRELSSQTKSAYTARVVGAGTNGYYYELPNNNGTLGTWTRLGTL